MNSGIEVRNWKKCFAYSVKCYNFCTVQYKCIAQRFWLDWLGAEITKRKIENCESLEQKFRQETGFKSTE